MRKSVKNFSKCLIFNDLLFYAILYACFTHALRKLASLIKVCYTKTKPTHQLLDFQRFSNITQTLDFQRFYASQGAGRMGQE